MKFLLLIVVVKQRCIELINQQHEGTVGQLFEQSIQSFSKRVFFRNRDLIGLAEVSNWGLLQIN